MIKHEEVRAVLNGNESDLSTKDIMTKLLSGDYTLLAMKRSEKDKINNYITEQEKKDELLELYKDFYNNDGKTTIENYYKIKALEEELK